MVKTQNILDNDIALSTDDVIADTKASPDGDTQFWRAWGVNPRDNAKDAKDVEALLVAASKMEKRIAAKLAAQCRFTISEREILDNAGMFPMALEKVKEGRVDLSKIPLGYLYTIMLNKGRLYVTKSNDNPEVAMTYVGGFLEAPREALGGDVESKMDEQENNENARKLLVEKCAQEGVVYEDGDTVGSLQAKLGNRGRPYHDKGKRSLIGLLRQGYDEGYTSTAQAREFLKSKDYEVKNDGCILSGMSAVRREQGHKTRKEGGWKRTCRIMEAGDIFHLTEFTQKMKGFCGSTSIKPLYCRWLSYRKTAQKIYDDNKGIEQAKFVKKLTANKKYKGSQTYAARLYDLCVKGI